MFCMAGYQSTYQSLSKHAYKMAEEYLAFSSDKKLTNEQFTSITNYINNEPLISKKIFISLDLITSIVFITLSILSFTGVLPNVALGGSIAMVIIGSINLILLPICSLTTRDIKPSPDLEEKFNKDKTFIDVL